MKTLYNLTFLFFLTSITLYSQNYKEQLSSINIEHYKLAIEVNDENNNINALMAISMRFKKNIKTFDLDFVEQDSLTGKGMKIDSVFQNNIPIDFLHQNNKLTISPKHIFQNLTYTFTIKYSGIPKTGLIITNNKFGDRTIFGDNWPNRAQNWFPCIDHPSEKATIEYIVTAPDHYQVIANGLKIRDTILPNNLKQTHYKTKAPLPTKVMVIGVANFEIQDLEETHNIPISSWVYPQDKEAGFNDFSTAKNILDFFIETIGKYPFQKLTNVQSTTEYGGMENAGAIFYNENAITGEGKIEALMAHEIAHQWFGNSVSEIDWPHIWLSEGFATYFANLYIQKSKGDSIFQKRMVNEREKVFNLYKKQQTPIVDSKTTNYIKLLNANTYQKGAWVLHMLRKELGDDVFFKGIKAYYQIFKYSNASSHDFQQIMSHVAEKNLNTFFRQWLTKADYPILKTQWIYFNNKVRLIIDQTQSDFFEFSLDIEIIFENGKTEIQTVSVDSMSAPFVLTTSGENGQVKELKLDPNNWLLFQMVKE